MTDTERITIRLTGALYPDDDIEPGLALETIESISVKGVLEASGN